MRLNKIKLAGFKSFVDPTTLNFQTELTSIVGPNGCGKSNIVDAIRWVTGEGSAKKLRGESMTDVIFNGTSERKPVGKASVELIFDNSDGRVGGEYAAFSEISIRREVDRESQSSYFLNNTRCRRKDITDILLGTGLGARSYAIIEQGMISQIIEAKPEELRNYVEEASGIAKYKERRRETENRIRHTRENLDRLNDLRGEIDKQLAHLKRQADAAERYKVLKQEQRQVDAELNALNWRTLNEASEEHKERIHNQTVALEAEIAKQRHSDAEIEKLRQNAIEKRDDVNEVQSEYYSKGADIARCEETINSATEREKQLEHELEDIAKNCEELTNQLGDDQTQAKEMEAEIERMTPDLERQQEEAEFCQARLQETEGLMQTLQTKWDTFNQTLAQTNQDVQVEQMRIKHLEERIEQGEQRLLQLEEERGTLDSGKHNQDIEALTTTCDEEKDRLSKAQEDIKQTQHAIQEQRQIIKALQNEYDEAKQHLNTARAERTSLQTLQDAALGKSNAAVGEFLKTHQLDENPRLAQGIRVDAGWERAVETVMSPYLEAVCVDDIQAHLQDVNTLSQGQLSMVNITDRTGATHSNHGTPLATKIQSDWPIASLLNGIYIADNAHEALRLIQQLNGHESVITPDGLWFGKNWLRVNKPDNEHDSVIKREKTINALAERIATMHKTLVEQEQILEENRCTLNDLESQLEMHQTQYQQFSETYRESNAKLSALVARSEQMITRENALKEEISALETRIANKKEELLQARSQWQEAVNCSEEKSTERLALEEERNSCREKLQNLRHDAQHTKQVADELKIKIETQRNQIHYLNEARVRADKQLKVFEQRRQAVEDTLKNIAHPLPEQRKKLEALLAERLHVEHKLSETRRQLEEMESELNAEEKRRTEHDQRAGQLRDQLEETRMLQRTVQVKSETFRENIAKFGFELNELVESLPENADLDAWQARFDALTNRIERMGAINLAAIDEHKQLTERKNYLDDQNEDLIEALATLENAIRKIDHETRMRFRETFDAVNNNFKELFPKIFGGGTAYLELIDGDILTTGIMVRAQPPGKRNTSIHLLSGGEKALTAIALVFSFFQINPAPFCVLDEVDAPLDDVNVGRFCDLVTEMSKTVQFMVVSHNKITISMAKQLAGITMQEAGVSRLVSVDIDEAIAMAEA